MDINEDVVVDYDVFINQLYNLNPVGDAQIDYTIMLRHLGNKLNDGSLLTFELLVKRYSDYLKFVAPYNDIKEKQFIKKEYIRKPLGHYLIDQMYKSDYSALLVNDSDNYLFGI